ncbi:DUF1983 domain-containing protein [Enterobacter hormaechei subsp. xiangfangensis]|nr:DUF1983 domain-containing protein [Enterobacter hormaechei subsp. xiangfangensis]
MAVIAIGAIIAGASAAAAAYAAGAAIAVAIGIGIAVAALSGLMSYSAMQTTVPRFNSSDTATTLGTTSDPSTVIPVVYGQTRTGTINVWKSVGKDTTYLVQIFAVSEGQIDCFRNLYMDNKKILTDSEYRDGQVSKGNIRKEYKDFVEVEFSTGSPTGHVFDLAQKYLGKDPDIGWPDNATGNNVAAVCVVMRKRNKDLENQADILQPNSQVAVDVNGLLITDLTNGQRVASRNGPSQLLDYVLNERYGLGITQDKIDIESFTEAANYAYGNNLHSDGSPDPNASFKENITQIAAAFNGLVFESFGKMTCKIDGPDVVSYDFNEENITAGTVSLSSGGSENYYNTLNVKYQDPNVDYSDQVLRYPSDVTNDATIAKDKRIIAKDIDYRFVKEKSQLDIIASIERNKSMLKQTISFGTSDAYTVQVWDVIRVNMNELMLSDSLWRITSISRSMEKGAAGQITITATEYIEEVYTDLDYAKDPNNNGSNIPNAGYLIPPRDLKVSSVAETAIGKTFKVEWTCDDDYNRSGFYVQYAISGTNQWYQAGFTSGFFFMIMNMDPLQKYDIRVCSAGVLYTSDWVYLNDQNPVVSYDLPSVTGLHLVNAVENATTTTANQFEFAWDDQSAIKFYVHGTKQTFNDVFQYYLIEITGQKTVSYRTKDLKFIYDFRMNQQAGLSREINFKITAIGYAGMKSAAVQLKVKNNQAPAIQGFQALSGPNLLMCTWNDPLENNVPDYAGTIVQVASDQSFTDIKKVYQSSSQFLDNFDLADGKYYVRSAWYDVFGTDNTVWSQPVYVDMKFQVNWDEQDVAQLEDLLELDKKLEKSIDDAYELAKEYTDKTVIESQEDTLNKADLNAKAQIETLHTTVTNERDGAISQAISKVESDFDGKLGKTNAKITEVEKTQANDRAATAESIKQVRAETDSKVATVSQQSKAEIDKVTGTINSKWAVQTNADGVVAGISMLATNDPNGTKRSQIIFNADRIAITNNDAPTGAVPPFMVESNKVYLQSAMIRNASIGSAQIADASINNAKIANAAITDAKIQNASITGAKIVNGSIDNAKIGNQINSDTWNGSTAGWMINKNGNATFNNVTVRGRVEADSGYFKGRIEANDGYFKGTVYAEHIEGDVMIAEGDTFSSVSQPTSGNSASAGYHHVFWIKGEDYDRVMDTNLTLFISCAERNRFSLVVRTPGKADQEYFYKDTGNDGGNWTNGLRGITIPAAGKGQRNEIVVRITDNRAGSKFVVAPQFVTPMVSSTVRPDYSTTGASNAVREKSYIAFFRKGANLIQM